MNARQPSGWTRFCRGRDGIALLFTLAAVALLSVLIVAYLSKTLIGRRISFGSAGQARADFLSRSAMDLILGDLREEIRAGSDAGTTYQDAASGIWIYKPINNKAAMPIRTGTSDTLPNLIKRSVSATAFWNESTFNATPTAPIRAVAVNSETDPASNGQYISKKRWNKSYLLGETVPPAFVAPDWVLITRQGPFRDTTTALPGLAVLGDDTVGNANYVIGRFSYLIFDQGGLLDINQAGNGLTASENSRRGLIHQAALAAIPGLGDPSAFVNWRDPVTRVNTSYLFSGLNSFLIPAAGNQRLLGRQDLLRYARDNPSVVGTQALPYLGTFSREWNAPSWVPATPTGSTIDYAAQANSTAAVNRAVANVRFPSATPANKTITGYKSDGTSFSYTVNPGESLVQRRFPLARLAWLGTNGPAAGISDAAIQACFGLKWNASNLRWDYVGAAGSTPQSSIKTLNQVADEQREPNYFELLKAAILEGSTGLVVPSYPQPDSNGYALSVSDWDPFNATNRSYNSGAVTTAVLRDRHILQIGMNIIDQSDADSFPIRVFFSNFEFYGSENLPYLYRMSLTAYRPLASSGNVDGDPSRNVLSVWWEPTFWNPLQTTSTYNGPTQFRLRRVSGTVYSEAILNPGTTYKSGSVPGGTSSYLQMDYADWSSVAANPILLGGLKSSGATLSSDSNQVENFYTGDGLNYAGFWAGSIFISSGEEVNNVIYSLPGNQGTRQGPRYALEANYSGQWKEVQRFGYGANGGLWESFTATDNRARASNRRIGTTLISDPRTFRFGIQKPDLNSDGFANFISKTAFWDASNRLETFWQPQFIAADNHTNAWWMNKGRTYRLADNSGARTNSNDPNYPDPDGVVRPGDGWYSSDASNTLPMQNGSKYRPVQLNRPFRSVAEMGYTFRDMPWRSLDFSNDKSADAALLDFFCMNDADGSTGLVAGKVNLNTRNPEVLKAMILGAARQETNLAGSQINNSEAQSFADALTALTRGSGAGQGPLLNKSELVTRFGNNALFSATSDANKIKTQKEAVIRALAESGQTRTWNLLIDVVAQAGRYPANRPGATLKDFMVEGERRYWLHVAVDRYTGKVVDRQMEMVSE
ncbi:MAG: hypothetical protein SFU85_12550 [Candidatus Methylacidiphilales bacterium]|nr:hypothetical protein [Candidatus Methylacidiphilales bacterium]